ncbi:MAG: hypothetical protein HKN10_17830, partial [Myxococcales bacterium]|nr:hypothetical protein [Myxococcales bacterium]
HLFGKVAVAGGLFTNISAAPDVPATAAEYSPEQINIWGASFSIGLDTKGYRFTVGANGYFGRGDALAATVDPNTVVVSYDRTRATVSAVVVYIAGAVSVATKGAKDAQDKIKDKRKGEPEGGNGTENGTENEAGNGTGNGTGSAPADSN